MARALLEKGGSSSDNLLKAAKSLCKLQNH
jgi:hypothetical protein